MAQRPRRPGLTDIVDVVVADHRRFEHLLTAMASEQDPREALARLSTDLDAHGAAEEELLHPLVAAEIPGGSELARDSSYEHRRIDETMRSLTAARHPPPDLVARLGLELRYHMQDEESGWLHRLGRHLSVERRHRLGVEFLRLRAAAIAPTKGPPDAAGPRAPTVVRIPPDQSRVNR